MNSSRGKESLIIIQGRKKAKTKDTEP